MDGRTQPDCSTAGDGTKAILTTYSILSPVECLRSNRGVARLCEQHHATSWTLEIRRPHLPDMDAFTPWQPVDKVVVEINGMLIHVPKNTTNVYLAQAHVNPPNPDEVSGQILSTDLMFAWTWLIEALAEGGWGEVVAFDVAIKTNPRWSRSLGLIDGPTKHPNRLRHTSADTVPERSA
ncbi:hypothetical protein ACTWPT_17770 [Nonomuraea sp. 3N208]|uniref:hypothetical protein n=1 Tax=Nonomuraea sp. 3N208 TaxID=3457421 RepID=UPI003FCC58DE